MTRKVRIIFLLLIVLLGCLLRFSGLYWGQGYRYFAIGDEIGAYRVALNYLAGDERAQYIGQPAFGGGRLPGPLWAIFWSLPLRIGTSAEGVIFLMILLNTVVIYLVYLLAHKLLGPKYSLWTVLFYATSPWPIYYSVGAWNPLPMALFGVILYLALWDVTKRPASPNIFWVCLLMAVMPHFHMVSVFMVPAILIILSLGVVRINKKWLVVGLVVAIAVYIPYFLGEMNNHWENTRRILSGGWKFSFGVLRVLTTPVGVLSNLISRWTGYHFSDYKAFGDSCFSSFFILAFFNMISLSYGLLFVGSFILDFIKSLRGRWLAPRQAFRDSPELVFIGIILLLPPLLFVLTGHGYNSRYAIAQFPTLFLLPALFIVTRLNGRWRRMLISGVAVTIVFNVLLILAFFSYQGKRIEEAEYFIPTFRKMEMLRQTLRVHAGPARRIRIDAEDFLAAATGEPARGGLALSQYINLREEFSSHSQKPLPEQIYQLRKSGNLGERSELVAYQGNGIALVALPDN